MKLCKSSLLERIIYRLPELIWLPWLKRKVRKNQIRARKGLRIWFEREHCDTYWKDLMKSKEKEKPKHKPRSRAILESFAKGLVKSTAKHLGPDNAVKMVEAIQKFGEALTPGSKKPEELKPDEIIETPAEEIGLSKETIDELEQLIKNSENKTESETKEGEV